MRRVTRTGVMAVAAVSGAMAVALPAHADSTANGSAAGSPGLISGNGVQLPVHLPVNLCGNTVNVVGVLNPAAGNTCADVGTAAAHGAHRAPSGTAAEGSAKDSPGVVSGNGVQLPVHLPVNVGGNSVNVVGIADPAFGNESVNAPGEEPVEPSAPAVRPPVRHDPPSQSQHPGPRAEPPAPALALAPQAVAPVAALARTGADATLPALGGGAALVLGGALLYRRFRPSAER
ncbi:chaplin [Streptomyces rishiriensis]|uniref:chaplin n=1 Tax=Streptomyces rishiriensis TaxID=68264 RepID=UPI0033D0CC4F